MIATLDALLETGLDKLIEVAIQYCLGITGLNPGSQILDHLIGLQNI